MANAKLVLDSVTPRIETAIIKFHVYAKPGYFVPGPLRLYYSSRKSFSTASTIKSTFNYTEIALDDPNLTRLGYDPSEGTYFSYVWSKPFQDKTKYWIQLRMQVYTYDGDATLSGSVGSNASTGITGFNLSGFDANAISTSNSSSSSSSSSSGSSSGVTGGSAGSIVGSSVASAIASSISLGDFVPYKKWTTYRNPKTAMPMEFGIPGPSQPLFEIATYTNYHKEEDSDDWIYDTDWEDFTDLIALPSYDVNYEDITETWDDANYVSHITRVRKRISGKFSLWFSDLTRYNTFIKRLKENRERNGEGEAYVMLRLQVNNEIDEESTDSLSTNRPVRETGIFTIKMDSNPWVAPIFGHYDRYSAVNITIQQA